MKLMKCPYCDHTNTKVLDSRPANENKSIRRRRECERCSKRFTTFEMIEETPLIVIKKDGSREEFSRDKILRGLIRACEKRPVSVERLERSCPRLRNLCAASPLRKWKANRLVNS